MTAESWEANSKEACFHNKIVIRIAVEALSLFVHIYSTHFPFFFPGQKCKQCIQENVVHFQYNPVNVCFEVYRELLPNSLMLLIVIHKWISKWLMSFSIIHVGILAPNFFYIILLHQKHAYCIITVVFDTEILLLIWKLAWNLGCHTLSNRLSISWPSVI